MAKVERQCLEGGKTFWAERREVNRGYGKYCSLKCSARHRGRLRRKTEQNTYCSNCEKPIRRRPSRLREYDRFYCSRKCKHESQRKSPEERSYSRIRADLVKALGSKCSVCGYDKIVEIHHINGRDNNDLDNLMALCPNCHAELHAGLLTL